MERKSIRKVINVDGMTCVSCEQRIERGLNRLEGILEVKADYTSSSVAVVFDPDQILIEKIIETIEQLDYIVRKEEQQIKYKKKTFHHETDKIVAICTILLAGYLVIKHTIGFNFIPEVSQGMGYGVLFIVGLLTSIHCIAMCGGINLSQCVGYKTNQTDNSKLAKLKPSFLYNAGRVTSYTIIGGIVGSLGAVVSFSGWAKGIVAILSGLFMMIMGLNMLNIFPWLRKFNPRMPKIFGTKIHQSRSNHGPYFVGLINGFMPCGPLQAMQLYALGTGSFLSGALSMFFFSLGTVPLMFGFGAISSVLSRKFTKDMMLVSSILVIILGVVMAGRGLSLSGLSIPSLSQTISSGSENVAVIDGDIQRVTTSLEGGRYTPIVVQQGIPVEWTIKVGEGDLNGCNNPVTIPKYNLQKELVVGDNVIEFIPTEEGNITYTCWMGMIRSNIKVVSDVTSVSSSDIASSEDVSNDNLGLQYGISGGGCCADSAKATEFANGNIPTDDIAVAKIENNQQVVTVTVNDYGYSPAVVVLQKGVEAKIKFNVEQINACNNIVQFPEYNGQLDLNDEAQRETPWLVPEQDFTFQCWMGMLHGYVKVVDDISTINLDEIREEVEAYQPASGGGCCN